MRYVLEKHAQSLGFAVDATDSYAAAADSLIRQFQQFGTEYTGLLLGWPIAPEEDAAALASLLEQATYKGFPVVVMSTDMRAETRAWAAARDNTAVLAWKEYQGLESHLQRLIEVSPEDADTFPSRFDNSDIHLLVVDDSDTIRFSLRDLFLMQGYKVSLAATQQEALTAAEQGSIDIAILDYYLSETTGDLLCRALLSSPSVGDIICTVLTGTYSDHIIKRSLRAGAVECMFKNESSELLLSRIDAISQLVRQRRQLTVDRQLSEEVIAAIAGAVLIIESDQRIGYISDSGLAELGQQNSAAIIGQPSETLLELKGPVAPGSGVQSSTWRLPDGQAIDIDYEQLPFNSNGRRLIRFTRASLPVNELAAMPAPVANNGAVPALARDFSLNVSAEPFLAQLLDYLDTADKLEEKVSLLILDVFTSDADKQLASIAEVDSLTDIVTSSLQSIYARPYHLSHLSNNRFGFLLCHLEEAHAYLLVRKIMQLVVELKHDGISDELACTGAVVSISNNANHSAAALIRHGFAGVDLVNTREPNQALLLDLRRMLSAYPVEKD